MWNDFKAFILRGNVLDLAVAVILGAAFGRIVSSLVDDVLMPPLGLALGGVDFKELFVDLSGRGYRSLAEATAAGAPTLRYGLFLNALVNFLVIASAIFLLVRQLAWLLPRKPPEAPVTRECPFCLSVIPLAARRCAHCTSEIPTSA
jgi:large conductance mechanosensitive channel